MYKLRIKEYRIRNKISQEQLACKIGLSQNYLCELENNKYDIKLSVLCKIAKELNVSPKKLFQYKK